MVHRFLGFYGRWQGMRGGAARLPAWAKGLLLIAAIPGVALLALSTAAFFVSVVVLLILTMPLYRLLCGLCGARAIDAPRDGLDGFESGPPVTESAVEQAGESFMVETPMDNAPKPPRRHIDVKIVE